MKDIIYVSELTKTKFITLKHEDYSSEELIKNVGLNKLDSQVRTDWHYINNKWYYFKSINELPTLINELLGVIIAKEINLPTIEYQLAKKEYKGFNLYGLISPSFIDHDKTYYKANQLSKSIKDNNQSNLKAIKKLCKNDSNYNELINDLYKLSLLDFYTNQLDRVADNITFVKDNNGLHLSKIYDYSITFDTLDDIPNYDHYVAKNNIYTYYNKDNNRLEYICGNYLFSLTYPSDETIKIFSNAELKESLLKLYNFRLDVALDNISETLNSGIPKSLILHYNNFIDNKKYIIDYMLNKKN